MVGPRPGKHPPVVGVAGAVEIERLTGVYHADGGLRGELRYLVGKVRGTAHCALCDITHGAVSAKKEWKACAAALPVPIEVVHRNERSPAVAAFTGDRTPVVVAHTDRGLVEVLGPEQLDALGGDVEGFRAAVEERLGELQAA